MAEQIEFVKKADRLLLKYSAEEVMIWLPGRFASAGQYHLRRTFLLTPSIQEHDHGGPEENEDEQWDIDENSHAYFVIAQLEGQYFSFSKGVLGIDYDLLIHKDVRLSQKMFTAVQNTSVFSKIGQLGLNKFTIGGDAEESISETDFYHFISKFPNQYELKKYTNARIGSILKDYVPGAHKEEAAYQRYLNKKMDKQKTSSLDSLASHEILKFKTILERLEFMLAHEDEFSEHQWQIEILMIIRFLFPQYVGAFRETPVFDSYNEKLRGLDYMLIMSNGSVDIAEIKKPMQNRLISTGQYRDNYIPMRDLSGTVMQVEKYLFHLMKWGRSGEDYLNRKYEKTLPDGVKIQIVNPQGIMILGRSFGLSSRQLCDFDVIRRQYKNVVDIITYDDLLSRLRSILESLTMQVAESKTEL